MPNRPWPLILLAIFQFLTPVVNVFFNAWALKVAPSVVLGWWFQRPAIEIFESFALMPIAGFAIFRMKRWSYYVFFAALLWNLVANLRYWEYAVSSLPAASVIFYSVLNVVLVTYFLLPAVRRTFFDSTVRWWETEPRYEVQAPVRVQADSGTVLVGKILNISQGGAFIQLSSNVTLQSEVELKFNVLSHVFEVKGRIVHVRTVSTQTESDFCYGVQFDHTAESRARFRNLVVGLGLIGFTERTRRKGVPDTLVDGVVGFLKTGRGLVPEYSVRGKGKTA